MGDSFCATSLPVEKAACRPADDTVRWLSPHSRLSIGESGHVAAAAKPAQMRTGRIIKVSASITDDKVRCSAATCWRRDLGEKMRLQRDDRFRLDLDPPARIDECGHEEH